MNRNPPNRVRLALHHDDDPVLQAGERCTIELTNADGATVLKLRGSVVAETREDGEYVRYEILQLD